MGQQRYFRGLAAMEHWSHAVCPSAVCDGTITHCVSISCLWRNNHTLCVNQLSAVCQSAVCDGTNTHCVSISCLWWHKHTHRKVRGWSRVTTSTKACTRAHTHMWVSTSHPPFSHAEYVGHYVILPASLAKGGDNFVLRKLAFFHHWHDLTQLWFHQTWERTFISKTRNRENLLLLRTCLITQLSGMIFLNIYRHIHTFHVDKHTWSRQVAARTCSHKMVASS